MSAAAPAVAAADEDSRRAPNPERPIADAAWRSLALAVDDLIDTFGANYPDGPQYLERLAALRVAYDDQLGGAARDTIRKLDALRREALLANPLLDFDRLLLIERGEERLGLPQNWQGNTSVPSTGYDNRLAVLSPVRPDGRLTTLIRPEGGRMVSDVDLHFDANRLLLSMPGENDRWQVFELNTDGTGLRSLPLINEPDVDTYDACYLPDGNVVFSSTAPFAGVPCVRGRSHVANLFLLETRTGRIRQLTFDQEHNWCPTVLNDGRLLYLRWEYSGLPHFVGRILFEMNPDGTAQRAVYGTNSYWPNSMFYARPVPGHSARFVAIVGGHHGVPRMGELVLFDAAKGAHEADGVIQRIPGFGKSVAPILLDKLVDESWPKFLHPWPLSDKYFIVSAQPTPTARWGVYLVDVFDNRVLLKESDGYALLEPIPLRKTPKPPIIPNRVQPEQADAVIHLGDVYAGPGLDGVPRGAVKKLRLFSYHYAYQEMGGQDDRVGLDGPWDIKRIIGTVPVEPDGSAHFRVPANTPISVQPLDAEGKALQLMRSWFTAMPGETLSCIGCHAKQSTTPPTRPTLATGRPPSEITPWYGPTRGFSFKREVQPVLEKYCVGCHDGQPQPDRQPIPDLRAQPAAPVFNAKLTNSRQRFSFTPSYVALRRLVRSATIESDMHLLPAGEFHADTTELVQMLRQGHHGVRLDAEAWDRLITWIDLNTPAYGTWHELVGDELVTRQRDRRRIMMERYAGLDEDPEVVYEPLAAPTEPILPEPPSAAQVKAIDCPDWPFDAAEAKRRQARSGVAERRVDLGGGVTLELARIPAGAFVMGDPDSHADEQPSAVMKIERPFWIGRFEVTNEQFNRFDPAHDSRVEHGDYLQFSIEQRGKLLNRPRQPVARISWHKAMAFCDWLSRKTGETFTLPTEAQWEYACRAGTDTALWYGAVEADFARFANLADTSFKRVDTLNVPEWRAGIDGVDDGYRVSAPVGSYRPNPWGLHDMHGNVWEWTRTDGRNGAAPHNREIVRGGSWYDRPHRARSGYRLAYRPYLPVYNVGFRVVSHSEPVARNAQETPTFARRSARD